ncbi:MAG: hypothetical protein KBF32_13100 [Chitinophagales bacterium]|nr:hypothetical protein [Chitinophagaceae bacterium]MBP9884339.1 hypothetical protein [Chitinophagales bacterium]
MERKGRRSRVRDNIYFGAFLGLVFPIVGFLLFYVFAFYERMSLSHYWDQLFNTSKLSAALSLAVVTNLPVFFYLITARQYENVKGLVGATMFYGIFIILFKFF